MNRSVNSAHARGLAHLKKAEYAKAITAFTEALGVDPEAANAYLGRGLAYRSLGDETAARRDEEAAKALGGPERSAWDRLVKRAYRVWRVDLKNPAWDREDRLCRDAFLLQQWTWQIYNGGLPQWVANGYGAWAADLAAAAERIETDAARAVAAVIREVAGLLTKWPGAREALFRMMATGVSTPVWEDEFFRQLSQCEEQYYRVGQYRNGPSFAMDVEEWFESQYKEPKESSS